MHFKHRRIMSLYDRMYKKITMWFILGDTEDIRKLHQMIEILLYCEIVTKKYGFKTCVFYSITL